MISRRNRDVRLKHVAKEVAQCRVIDAHLDAEPPLSAHLISVVPPPRIGRSKAAPERAAPAS